MLCHTYREDTALLTTKHYYRTMVTYMCDGQMIHDFARFNPLPRPEQQLSCFFLISHAIAPFPEAHVFRRDRR